MKTRLLDRFAFASAFWPIAWLFLFYAFVFRARLELGYWPTPSYPDPKSLGFGLHHAIIWLGLFAWPVLSGCALVLALLRGEGSARFPFWITVTLLVISLALTFAVIWSDPGRFMLWFAD